MPAVFNAKVNDAFNEWSKGYGKIQHTSSTMNIVEKYLSQHYHAACGEQSELLNAIELLKQLIESVVPACGWLPT